MDSELNVTVGAKDRASDTMNRVDKAVGKISNTAENVQERLKKASVAIAAIGVGLTAYSKAATNGTLEYVRGVKTLSTETGMATDQTIRLIYAFERYGVTIGMAQQTLSTFSKQIQKSNDKTGEAAQKQQDLQMKIKEAQFAVRDLTNEQKIHGDKTGEISLKLERLNLNIANYKAALTEAVSPLQKLGISTKNADGTSRSFNDILLDVSDKFKTMPNGAEKTALALELFGRSGKALIPVLNQGRDGLAKMAAEADKLGLTLTPQNVAKVNQYILAQKKLKETQQALTLAVGTQAIPMWEKLTQAQTAVVGSVLKLPEPLNKVAVSVLAFGGPIATGIAGLTGFAANLSDVATAVPGVGKALSVLGSSFGALGGLLFSWPGLILAVIAGVVLLLNHFGYLQPMIAFVKDAFSALWVQMQTSLRPAFDMVRGSLVMLQPYLPAIGTALKWVAIIIGGILVGSLILAVNTFAAVIQVVTWFGVAMIQGISNAIAFVSDIISIFINLFQGHFDRIPTIAGDALKRLLNILLPVRFILDIFQGVFNGLVQIVGGGLNLVLRAAAQFVGIFSNSGKALIEAFAHGIEGGFDKAKAVVNKGLSAIRRMLPFSDAKEGPLSTLTLSGRRFSETFATGIDIGAPEIAKAANEALSGVSPVINATAAAPSQPGDLFRPAFQSIQPTIATQTTQAPTTQPTVNQNFSVNVTVENDGTSFTESQAVDMAKKISYALRSQGLSLSSMGALR